MAQLNKVGILITAFVILTLAITFLSTLADSNSNLQGNLATVTDDTFTAANYTCTQVTNGCITSITSVENLTDTFGADNYSACRTSSGNQDGIILYADGDAAMTAVIGETTNVTYVHSAGCTYVADGTSRSLLTLIPIFFALGVLAYAVWAFMKSKEGAF